MSSGLDNWAKKFEEATNSDETIGAMAKYYSSEIAVQIANDAVQVLGGYGFTKDFPVERFYRDCKLCTFGEGTSEIQKLVIAKQIIG